jgi:hypothetical protein
VKVTVKDLEELTSRIGGSVLTSESEEYDAARSNWELSVVQKPQVIVVARNASDIAEAVRFAKDHGLKVAVKSTGHGAAIPADDGLLIVVSSMKKVEVDPVNKTARVEAGAQWIDVLQKAQDEGLAPLMGSSSDVGAVGYTVGGGMGWLSRKYGLSVDNVISFDVVTGTGEILKASKDENQDLFWGLCGSGPALGVVTAMEIRLVPVKDVYAGNLIYPREAAKEVFSRYREWIEDIEDDWSTSIAVANFPPLPIVPEFLQGKSVVIVRGCYDGPEEKGEEAIRSWTQWKEPMANLFGVIPFRDSDTISNDPKDPIPASVTNIILTELNDDVFDTMIRRGFPQNEPIPLLFGEIYHAGGAVERVDRSSNAYSQRDAKYILKLLGLIPTEEMKLALGEIIEGFRDELKASSKEGVYLNFLVGSEKWNRTRDAFSQEAFEKLVGLKRRYDPENMFCFNLNIPLDK